MTSNLIRRSVTSLALALALLLPVGLVSAADVLAPGCTDNPNATLCKDNQNESPGDNRIYGPNGILTKAARIVSLLVGVAAVIMIIVGAIQYTTSSGDSSNINNAKNTILYAIIGLIVALLAQAIIVFVIGRI